MILIKKGNEPEVLQKLREKCIEEGLTAEQAYKRLRGKRKDKVRDFLMRDQSGLCAYCMCRIPRNDVPDKISPIVIEHFMPRNPENGVQAGQGLDYQNLFLVCHGNRAPKGVHKISDLTCDAHRGNKAFRKIHPGKQETLETIKYLTDGKIDADDPDVRYDLVEILNLNCPSSSLVSERKAVLDGLIDEMVELDLMDLELKDFLEKRLEFFENESGTKTEYVGVLIWYLKSLIKELA